MTLNIDNDLCMVTLNEPIQFGPTIQRAILPVQGAPFPAPGKNLYSVSWGKDKFQVVPEMALARYFPVTEEPAQKPNQVIMGGYRFQINQFF